MKEIQQQLENIGLNNSEVKVYLALLKLGPTTTGPIIKKSQTANSKIYVVLEKLILKGLVSEYSQKGVQHYKATSPNMLLHFLEEKQQRIEKDKKLLTSLIPALTSLAENKEIAPQASVFTGIKGVKAAFVNLVDSLEKGDEVHIMGVHDFGSSFMHSAQYFQKIRSHKGIKAKFLINKDAQKVAEEFSKYPPVEIKMLPKEVFTPAIFLIYKDTVIINMPKEMTFFVLESHSAAQAFDSYFTLLWNST